MSFFKDIDEDWGYHVQTPMGFGVGFFEDEDPPKAVYVFYFEDHLEIVIFPLDPLGELVGIDKEVRRVPYHEPLNECPDEPEVCKPYMCTLWCRSGLAMGAYPFPV